MAQTPIRFYLDENLSPQILEQLRLLDIDAIRGPLGADDPEHIARARAMRRVICTEDDDFLKLAAAGMEHAGIIKGEQDRHYIGDWVKFLQFTHEACEAEDMRNHNEYVFPVDQLTRMLKFAQSMTPSAIPSATRLASAGSL